jgi:hypothetical protein
LYCTTLTVEQRDEFRQRRRPPEQIALHGRRAMGGQEARLCFRLHTFGDKPQSQMAGMAMIDWTMAVPLVLALG